MTKEERERFNFEKSVAHHAEGLLENSLPLVQGPPKPGGVKKVISKKTGKVTYR